MKMFISALCAATLLCWAVAGCNKQTQIEEPIRAVFADTSYGREDSTQWLLGRIRRAEIQSDFLIYETEKYRRRRVEIETVMSPRDGAEEHVTRIIDN